MKICGVYAVSSGDNMARVSYTTMQGRPGDLHPKNFDVPVTVARIQIYR